MRLPSASPFGERTPFEERSPPTSAQGFGSPHWRKGSGTRAVDLLVTVILLWLVFSLIVCLFVFAYEEFAPLVWALLAASALLALLLVVTGSSANRPWHAALGLLSLVSLGVAVPVGLVIESDHMREYWRLDNGALYTQMNPADPSSSHSDATVLEFRDGTFVDVKRSVGYMKSGTIYCVAPVLSKRMETSVQYWATGIGCCAQRGMFTCDDAEDPSAGSALSIVDATGRFQGAVRMAESVYDFTPAQTLPMLVMWLKDATAFKDELWSSAATLVAVASGTHLVIAVLAAAVFSRYIWK
mmetsp:Transcript_77038/g.178678  ORF Transcript_77038/g.178678 Transcript_77038/m.178678 type:complete len:299 (+) Transcript_77038:73-969(+)